MIIFLQDDDNNNDALLLATALAAATLFLLDAIDDAMDDDDDGKRSLESRLSFNGWSILAENPYLSNLAAKVTKAIWSEENEQISTTQRSIPMSEPKPDLESSTIFRTSVLPDSKLGLRSTTSRSWSFLRSTTKPSSQENKQVSTSPRSWSILTTQGPNSELDSNTRLNLKTTVLPHSNFGPSM